MTTQKVGERPMKYLSLIGRICCANAYILLVLTLMFCDIIVNNFYNIGENLKSWANFVILCVVFL